MTVYDKYGVSKTASNYSMTIDGVKVAAKFAYVSGFGTKKFVLSYQVPSALAVGFHMVNITVHDLRSLNSSAHWGFTVVSADAVPPVTTSDVDPLHPYINKALILLTATDNVGGSGVAQTYFTITDAGHAVTSGTGPFVSVTEVGTYMLRFWSVDKAGNVEAPHTASFVVVNDMISATIHQQSTPFCTTGSGCHFVSLTIEHYQHTDPVTGARLTCQTCHASTDPLVVAAISTHNDACTGCHTSTRFHAYTTTKHKATASFCTMAGCHAGDVASIHASKLLVGITHDAPGCLACHDVGVTPSTDCQAVACHGANGPHAAHAPIPSAAVAGTAADCTKSACHGAVVTGSTGIHKLCVVCHAPTDASGIITSGTVITTATVNAAVASGHATCEDCHGAGFFTATHGTGNSSHVVSGSCFVSTCHGTDVTKMHGNDFRGTGETPPGCAACHANPNHAPSSNCTDCHNDLITPHDFAKAHASVETSFSTNSAACTACHGTDIKNVLPAGNPVTGVVEHNGCSCHAYFEAAGKTACQDCHAASHAPHGFAQTPAAPSASGHNTTLMGKVGAYSKFDGSQGVLVKDTNGSTITTAFPLPPNSVFWSADDSTAPTGAKKGLTWTSTITCEDCHTGLVAYEVAGPHGSTVISNAGLDPAFPGTFDQAYLWDGSAISTSSVAATNSNFIGGAPSSGIGRYVPGGTTEEQKQELANWDIGINGPARVYNGNDVICAKCHDLRTQDYGDLGWSNYGHEHHANRPVQFGTWRMSDGTTVTAATTPTSTVPSIVATVQVPTLGREGAGACRDCHIAIPHSWKRPRLIVYSSDPAPYNIGPSVYEGESKTATSGVTIGSGQMNGLSSVIGPKIDLTGNLQHNNWSSSQCLACGHHAGTDLSAGAWK